jgi:hypothetical protein
MANSIYFDQRDVYFSDLVLIMSADEFVSSRQAMTSNEDSEVTYFKTVLLIHPRKTSENPAI